jgi:hypothetical protein
VGSFTFTITATDGYGDSMKSPTYSISVTYSAITISPAAGSLPAGSVGVAYPQQVLKASGGTGGDYTWTVTGLPEVGLLSTANNATLTISGTPSTAETVTFTASVTDNANNSSGLYTYTIAVSAAGTGGSVLKGTYACLIRGFVDFSGDRFATLASFQADGNGNLNGGVFDSNSLAYAEASGTLTGTYTVDADGNGTASISSAWTTSGQSETVAWAFAVTKSAKPATQFSMVEADDAGASPSGRHATGNCYLATPSAFAASTLNGNSFVWAADGESHKALDKVSLGRVVFAASGMTVTGGSSDIATAGDSTLSSSTSGVGGSFTAPDSITGRLTLSLNDTLQNGTIITATYVVYLIDANRALVMGTNLIGPGDLFAGDARRQQQSSYSGANINGGFVFYTQALEFATSGSSTPTGYHSIIYQGTGDEAGNLTIAQSYISKDGTYTAGKSNGTVAVMFDSNSPGRATINGGSGVLYLFDTNSAFEISLGGGQNPIESGRMEPQTQTTFTDAALAGTYMMTEMAPLESNAPDQNGELTVGSDGSLKVHFTVGEPGKYYFDQSMNATYAWDTTGTGTFLAASPASWSCAVINSTRFVCVDQTVNPPAMRIFQQ